MIEIDASAGSSYVIQFDVGPKGGPLTPVEFTVTFRGGSNYDLNIHVDDEYTMENVLLDGVRQEDPS